MGHGADAGTPGDEAACDEVVGQSTEVQAGDVVAKHITDDITDEGFRGKAEELIDQGAFWAYLFVRSSLSLSCTMFLTE